MLVYHRWCSVTWMFHIYNKTLSFLQFSAVKIGPLVLYVWFPYIQFPIFGFPHLSYSIFGSYLWFLIFGSLHLLFCIWFSTRTKNTQTINQQLTTIIIKIIPTVVTVVLMPQYRCVFTTTTEQFSDSGDQFHTGKIQLCTKL